MLITSTCDNAKYSPSNLCTEETVNGTDRRGSCVYLLNLIIGRIRVGTNCMATMYNNENYINNNNKKNAALLYRFQSLCKIIVR